MNKEIDFKCEPDSTGRPAGTLQNIQKWCPQVCRLGKNSASTIFRYLNLFLNSFFTSGNMFGNTEVQIIYILCIFLDIIDCTYGDFHMNKALIDTKIFSFCLHDLTCFNTKTSCLVIGL